MPLITVKILEGRTLEQKRGLVRDITKAVVDNLKSDPEVVLIDIVDMSKENYSKAGITSFSIGLWTSIFRVFMGRV